MIKTKLLFTSLIICAGAISCEQQIVQNPNTTLEQTPVTALQSKTTPYQNQFTPSILKILKTPDKVSVRPDDLLREDEFGTEYVDHFKFFTAIDKTGSGVEEVLEHDGYANAHKYVFKWRTVLGENMDWPDHHSTTYNGKFPALEHATRLNGKGWFGLRNAHKKSDEYYAMALKTWKKGVAPDSNEQKESWEWLGRTAHFIQDATVPHHTRDLIRLDQLTHHPFEKIASKNFAQYFPSRNYNPGTWSGGPYPTQGTWGIYFDNTGIKTAGDIIRSNSQISEGLFKMSNRSQDENNGNWDKVRSLTLPLANKTCAGLIVMFLNQVGEKP